MNTADLTAFLERLRAEARESEWLEFKAKFIGGRTLASTHLISWGKS